MYRSGTGNVDDEDGRKMVLDDDVLDGSGPLCLGSMVLDLTAQ